MSAQEILINRIPIRTWERFKVNDKLISIKRPLKTTITNEITIEAPKDVIISTASPLLKQREEFLQFSSAEYERFFADNAVVKHHIIIPENFRSAEPITVNITLPQEEIGLAYALDIEVKNNAQAVIFLNYRSKTTQVTAAQFYGRINVVGASNTDVRVISNKLFKASSEFHENIDAIIEDNSKLNIIAVELAKTDFISSANVLLQGINSTAQIDIMYLGSGSQQLDMAYQVKHLGENTESAITAKGILKGQARKVFRDTINFVKGCRGSRSAESESILTLDSHVENISVPLLLCGECDVQGAHAVSIGKTDEKILFYLMTRGISPKESELILAKASLSSINDTIPSTSLQSAIESRIEEMIYEEEI